MLKGLVWTAANLPRLAGKLYKSPAFVGEVFTYVLNDAKAMLGICRYDNHIVYVAGLAKSGTTWIETELAKVPGYNQRYDADPNNVTDDWNVDDAVFNSLPKNRYSVLKLHTQYSEQNLACIFRHVPRFLVSIRDPRDIVLSRYYHIKAEPAHRHYRLYNEASPEEGIDHSIGIIAGHYVPWIQDWLKAAADNPGKIMVVRYEDLHRDPAATFAGIFSYFNLPVSEAMREGFENSKLKKEVKVEDSLKGAIGFRTRSTARKGGSGNWRKEFTEGNKKRFKELAGDALIAIGYERDLNW